jgi:short-subunit dehydrogenase
MTAISGSHTLLTGGSRGLGPVIAEALAQRGGHLALAARSEKGLSKVVESLRKYDVKTLAVSMDLTQSIQRQSLISTVMEEFGRVDILINNAGVETEGPFLDQPWIAIRDTIELNLTAPMELTYLVLPDMLDYRDGHIVNIASIAAKSGINNAATYSGTKAGLAEWTRGLRLELEGSGVHFSTIFPGYVTEVGMFARFKKTPPTLIGSCTPSQVAGAIVRAIEKEKIELVVNSSPLRLLFAVSEISPVLGDWFTKIGGGVDFQRRKLEQ